MIMDIDLQNSLKGILEDECEYFGEFISINGTELKALVSTSPTTKNLQIAGYYKRRTLDVIIAGGKIVPEINQVVLYKSDHFYIKQVEEMLYEHGYRFTMELIR
jgi:hypothetical protein